LQSTSSNLYQLRDRIERGLSFSGPALFSVYSGVPVQESSLPLYLSAAAAMQSRAFPAFSYDPSAGADLASRFSMENNPQPDADWAIHSIEYADPDMQRVRQEIAFTFLDFLVCDDRHHSHFAAVPRGFAAESMVPAAQWIASSSTESSNTVPYVLMAGSDNVLSRAIADDRVIGAARRCLENWHRLQESGGVHNSHAERLLKREKQVWEEQKRQELASQQPVAAPTPAMVAPSATTPTAAAAEAAATAPERNPDEAYIETERCTSCNECTLINDRMFAYNANKQAFIADPDAGTYRQLVEAAESCQVAIIHPGKPRNPNEAGLNELIERAASFR
jgi:cell division septation protein DedD